MNIIVATADISYTYNWRNSHEMKTFWQQIKRQDIFFHFYQNFYQLEKWNIFFLKQRLKKKEKMRKRSKMQNHFFSFQIYKISFLMCTKSKKAIFTYFIFYKPQNKLIQSDLIPIVFLIDPNLLWMQSRSILEYGAVIQSPNYKKDIDLLQLAQGRYLSLGTSKNQATIVSVNTPVHRSVLCIQNTR